MYAMTATTSSAASGCAGMVPSPGVERPFKITGPISSPLEIGENQL